MAHRKMILWSFGLLAVGVVAFAAANILDYYRFNTAIRRIENLSEAELNALAAAAARIDVHDRPHSLRGFEALRPISASLSPALSDFLIYELKPTKPRFEDDIVYLYVRITTSRNNQQIFYFTNSEGKQRSKVVWNRNPEFVRRHAPKDRLLTITQWSSDTRTWIVLRDQILVVDDAGTVGSEPTIVGNVLLNSDGLSRIKHAIASLPPDACGKNYRADHVLDGTNFVIRFTADGEPSHDDVEISNTWVEEFQPLLNAVSELSPPDLPITFIERLTSDAYLRNEPTIVRTLEEWDRINWGKPNTPWWCVWRNWF